MARSRSDAANLRMISRVSPTRQVRQQLQDAIDNGDYPVGSLLPSERQLCEAFGVSRVSVREALAGLEAIGMVEIQHGRGAVVLDPSDSKYASSLGDYLSEYGDDLLELLDVRQALDELAAAGAATKADDASRSRVDEAREAFKKAASTKSPDVAKLAKLDEQFHLAVATATGGLLVPDLVRELNGVLARSRELTLSQEGQLGTSIRDHDQIADAVIRGDERASRFHAREHIRQIRDRIGLDDDSV
jgi:GntR family transcriptional repressor for pyruvate dehydrogenase complex